MTELRVIIDQLTAAEPGGSARYAEELTRALILTAPPGCTVTGIVSRCDRATQECIRSSLPGLAALEVSPLGGRLLSLSWQLGLASLRGKGMVHATSLLAPLVPHDRLHNEGDQIVATVHDALPWTHPDTLPRCELAWRRIMAARAARYADAIVTPTHAVADRLGEALGVGDRIRVIGGAPSPRLVLPADAEERAARLELPERYLLAVATPEPRKGLEPLIRSLAEEEAPELPLLIVGPPRSGTHEVAAIAADAGLTEGRVRTLGRLDDADLAVALSRASVFVLPSLAEGFGLPLIEALSLGVPSVHSDAPALDEVAAGAGISVALEPADGYPRRLAEAIRGLLDSPEEQRRLAVAGRDRAAAFSWRDSAEQLWQLHADL